MDDMTRMGTWIGRQITITITNASRLWWVEWVGETNESSRQLSAASRTPTVGVSILVAASSSPSRSQ